MDACSWIAEQRIREAMAEGAFDNLPGTGRPLKLEDDSNVPEELRLGYKILRNAGYVPEEVADRKEVENLVGLLENNPDERRAGQARRRLEALVAKIGARRGRSVNIEDETYYAKILSRLARPGT